MTTQNNQPTGNEISADILKSFDIDSIKDMIVQHEEQIKYNKISIDVDIEIDFDNKDSLSKDEIAVYNKLSNSSNLINSLKDLLKQTQTVQGKDQSDDWFDNLDSTITNIIDDTLGDENSFDRKDISTYSLDDAFIALKFLNNNIGNYSDATSRTLEEFTESLSTTGTLDDIDTNAEAEIYQKKLIEIIKSKDGKNYVEGRNNLKGNFIIEISKFENDLKSGYYTVNGKHSEDSTINSLLLGDYLMYLEKKGELNIDKLSKTISYKFLKDLKNKVDSDGESPLKKMLLENGSWKILKQLNAIEPELLSRMKVVLSEGTGETMKDPNYYVKNKESIYLIKDLDLLLRVIEINNKDIEKNGQVLTQTINPTLLKYNPSLLFETHFIFLDLLKINNSFLTESDNADRLIKQSDDTYFIPNILVKAGYDKEKLIKLIDKYDIEKTTLIKKYLGEESDINIEKFGTIFNKIARDNSVKNLTTDDKKDLCEFIIYNYSNDKLANKHDAKKVMILSLIDKILNYGFVGDNLELLNFFSDDPERSLVLIKNDPTNILFIKQEMFDTAESKEKLFEAFINTDKQEQSMSVFPHLNISGPNELLFLFVKFLEKNPKKEDQNKILNLMLNSDIKLKLMEVFASKKSTDTQYIEKYPVQFNMMLKMISEGLSERQDTIITTGTHLKEEINGSKENKIQLLSKIKLKFKEYNIPLSKKIGQGDSIGIEDIYNNLLSTNKSNMFKSYTILDELTGDENKTKEMMRFLKELSLEEDKKELEALTQGLNTLGNAAAAGATVTKNFDKTKSREQVTNEIIDLIEAEVYGKCKINGGYTIFKAEDNYIQKQQSAFIENWQNNTLATNFENHINQQDENKELSIEDVIELIVEKGKVKGIIYGQVELEAIARTILGKTIKEIKIEKTEKELEHFEEYYEYIKTGNFEKPFEEYLENKKSDSGESKQPLVNESSEAPINTNYLVEEADYKLSGNTYTLEKDGVKITGITEKEKNLTLENKEAAKNLINFYKFFEELNLLSVWEYRDDLAKAMGTRNINLEDNNSLERSELLHFGKCIIKFLNSNNKNLNEKNKDDKNFKLPLLNENPGSPETMKAELRKFSGAANMYANDRSHGIEGEDRFKYTLRQGGIIGGAYFQTNTLRKKMKQ